jgi:SRSO17 transposase
MKDYCTGLMLPLQRKSVEPLAAHLNPQHAGAKHQSLLHFVGQADWSDEALLNQVLTWIPPLMEREASHWFWIVDDTGFPKKGKHSVGVGRQYCGQTGKPDNCRVAVSLSLATQAASIPIARRLYLPRAWCDDEARRWEAGIPQSISFATKPRIALEAAITKEVDYVHPHYHKFIEAAPFAVLATSGSDSLDASPRGDRAGFVYVHDENFAAS